MKYILFFFYILTLLFISLIVILSIKLLTKSYYLLRDKISRSKWPKERLRILLRLLELGCYLIIILILILLFNYISYNFSILIFLCGYLIILGIAKILLDIKKEKLPRYKFWIVYLIQSIVYSTFFQRISRRSRKLVIKCKKFILENKFLQSDIIGYLIIFSRKLITLNMIISTFIILLILVIFFSFIVAIPEFNAKDVNLLFLLLLIVPLSLISWIYIKSDNPKNPDEKKVRRIVIYIIVFILTIWGQLLEFKGLLRGTEHNEDSIKLLLGLSTVIFVAGEQVTKLIYDDFISYKYRNKNIPPNF